ncbi:MAG: hypothetical protein LBM63_00535 [Rikenellaceae bacterium]|nr:hypothetical protein [Rikenellaceae bacterium]
MMLVTASEFRKNQKKYFQLALNEKVGVKSGDTVFEIKPSKEVYVNPSPSGDPWFDDPRNMEELERGIAEVKAGHVTRVTLDEVKTMLGL